MYQYAAKFNKDIIPHIKGIEKEDGNFEITEIVDRIHNYQRQTKPAEYDS